MEMWDCGHLKVKQFPEDIVHSCAIAVAKKKFGIEFVNYLPKSIYHEFIQPIKISHIRRYRQMNFPTKHARLALCAVFVRSLCGFGAVYVRCLRGVCATLVRLWCGLCAILVRLWRGLCAILARL